ncbi:hypothetical protein LX36DRAFT_329598 [Colletotrichum falcatum]|nr:hypothetical protein LX36DRAFT_329598 [Colletotrichum falcatum]
MVHFVLRRIGPGFPRLYGYVRAVGTWLENQTEQWVVVAHPSQDNNGPTHESSQGRHQCHDATRRNPHWLLSWVVVHETAARTMERSHRPFRGTARIRATGTLTTLHADDAARETRLPPPIRRIKLDCIGFRPLLPEKLPSITCKTKKYLSGQRETSNDDPQNGPVQSPHTRRSIVLSQRHLVLLT